jgi:hypothetical protein
MSAPPFEAPRAPAFGAPSGLGGGHFDTGNFAGGRSGGGHFGGAGRATAGGFARR